MKVAPYSSHGRPAEVVTLVDQDTGDPGAGELVVDVEAVPVHIAEGTLRARIAGTYALDDVADAVAHAGKIGDERPGKIILLPG